MSLIKTTIFAASALAIVGFGATITPETAQAGIANNERLNVCACASLAAMSLPLDASFKLAIGP